MVETKRLLLWYQLSEPLRTLLLVHESDKKYEPVFILRARRSTNY